MAETNSSLARGEPACFEFWWGDNLAGTKQQLQLIGIGVGKAFPGEPGGPARRLTTDDPRGFSTKIRRAYDWEQPKDGTIVYQASISFPDREIPEPAAAPHAPGVTKTEHTYADMYLGTARALVDAGLLRMDHFPGQPGMRKSRVLISPDGEPWTGKICGRIPEKYRCPGSKQVEAVSRSKYSVRVSISDEVKDARSHIWNAREELAKQAFERLPRPAPLVVSTKARKAAERQIAARREWAEGVIKDGPHTEEQYRDKALEYAELGIDLIWNGVFRRGIGVFALKLDEEDREVLGDAFEDIREVVRKATVRRDPKLSAEIEQFRLAAGARTDASFQSFMSRALG